MRPIGTVFALSSQTERPTTQKFIILTADRAMLPRVDLIRTEADSWLLMQSPDWISNSIKKNGNWGPNESNLCKVFTADMANPVVIDVGANIGGFAIPVAKALMDSLGKVYCFEPQRIIFQQLCANSFLNRLDNVFAYNVALGENNGKLDIPELDFSKSQNSGGFSIDPMIRKEVAAEFTNISSGASNAVELRTLDSFELFENLAFIKADIEGTELEFFKGATETLYHNNYPPILFEQWENKDWYEAKADETKNFLIEIGYDLQRLNGEILAQHQKYRKRYNILRDGNRLTLERV